MFENELPSLPAYKVHCVKLEDIEVDYSLNNENVFFTLVNGCNNICCAMQGKVNTEVFDVVEKGNYENSKECNFKFLQLTSNVVRVDQSDIDLITGQKIELTEKQYCELNEYLKEKMELVG